MKAVAKIIAFGAVIWLGAFLLSVGAAVVYDLYGVSYNPESIWSRFIVYSLGVVVGWILREF
ncbi:hypothetical protein [Agrobacterium sp. 10MFCol1.1]|uniref:hypothetical protein n=1 Tax=Agrobacterium sp. 10MFCol1.1 TaxID=1150775 RepID=UPI0003804DCA|nr:hypothetical protein [Agrobacterium sp. 10MFCol1.1]